MVIVFFQKIKYSYHNFPPPPQKGFWFEQILNKIIQAQGLSSEFYIINGDYVIYMCYCPQAVWFGCDVGKHFERKSGALHLDM